MTTPPLRCRPTRFIGPQTALLVATLFSFTTIAEQNDDLILIDGISVITGSQTSNESDATPVLLSDVAFEATLIQASRLGPGGVIEDTTPEDWLRARRQAVLLRLLAAKARYLHESASDVDKEALQAEITAMVGGSGAMTKILARAGLAYKDLAVFSETAALALTQIRYFEEQVELPSMGRRRDLAAGSRSDRAGARDIVGRYRKMIIEDHTETQMKRWISELIDSGHIRMVR